MSIEHFEHLWEYSEKVSEEYFDNKLYDCSGVIRDIRENLEYLKSSYKESGEAAYEDIGKILFDLTYISKKLNINTFTALKDAIEDAKIEMLDVDNNTE